MNPNSPRWKALSASRFPWEREALDFVREGLPDYEPYRAWSNAEFLASDRSINEVDLIVLAPKGLFLVEIKSRPGRLAGDAATWRWLHDGREQVLDNPLLLANLKSKRLKEKLLATRAFSGFDAPRLYIQPLVFVSDPNIAVQLSAEGRQHVYGRGNEANTASSLRGILDFLTKPDPAERRRPLDAAFARALTRAMEEAGLRASQRVKRVGEWTMETLLADTRLHQDWRATHRTMKGHLRRVRIYSSAGAAGASRELVDRAARREFDLLREIDHPGILKALEYVEHDLGPTLLYEHDDRMQRLDLDLKQQGGRRTFDFRLHVLRSVAEALRYAHGKRLFHRALSPQSVLVAESDGKTRIKIFNWQTGVKKASSTTSASVTGTIHLGDLLEEGASAFLAPESISDADADGEPLDVFSLGALAYYLFAGELPAASHNDLIQRLEAAGDGLVLSSTADGITESLQMLVRKATHPEVTRRLGSVKEFLDGLEAVEDELTRPTDDAIPNPDDAKAGDLLQNGFLVKRRLGTGSSAVVFDVERKDRRYALKLALSPDRNERLRREAAALGKLSHPCVIHLEGVEELYGRVGLLLRDTVEETLSERLRHDLRLTLDQLRAWGDDLLKAVVYLEETGIPHRDIKPDNLGVTEGEKGRKRLVLFDFSLSSAPAEAIDAGTRRYVDPFLPLRKPRRWDLAAERWSAAITLYEMATGAELAWGDGKSAPAVQKVEATLDLELLEPAVREPLGAFFARAFRRDPRQRFDNAQDMLWAWQHAFEKAVPVITTGHADEAERKRLVAAASPETPLAEVGLSPLALSALGRLPATTVRDLLSRPKGRYLHIRGAGGAVRKEIGRVWEDLFARFPDLRTVESPVTEEPEAEPAASAALVTLAAALIPKRLPKTATTEKEVVPLLLGLSAGPWGEVWASQSDVARKLGVSVPQINHTLAKYRERWQKKPSLTDVRLEVLELLGAAAGVMPSAELETTFRVRRGEPETQRSSARAVLRAAAEAEHVRERPRWEMFRNAGGVFLAVHEDLARWAAALGAKADDLAARDPLLSPARVQEELLGIRRPTAAEGVPASRIVRLAAAASKSAALSPLLELYPRGLSALRALKLAAGVIPASATVTPEEIRDRVAARYPEAERLPDGPALRDLLREAGLRLHWLSGKSSFEIPSVTVENVRTSKSEATVVETIAPPPPADIAAATLDEGTEFDERLARQQEDGGWLVLTAQPRHLVEAEAALRARFPERAPVDLDAVFISGLRAAAKEAEIPDWSVVLAADAEAEGSADAANLRALVNMAVPHVETELARKGPHLLLVNPGLLFRYRRTALLDVLRERAGHAGETLRSVWLLAPLEEPALGPAVDGISIPVVTPAQWARIPQAWLRRGSSEAA